jgi:hypothetical protein
MIRRSHKKCFAQKVIRIRRKGTMIRERALKIVMVIVELLFVATFYGIVIVRGEEALQMMLSIYVTLGIFLLLASRNPSANRTLIAFTAWSSFAHAAVMTVQSLYDTGERMHLLLGSLAFAVVGIALAVLAPPASAKRLANWTKRTNSRSVLRDPRY